MSGRQSGFEAHIYVIQAAREEEVQREGTGNCCACHEPEGVWSGTVRYQRERMMVDSEGMILLHAVLFGRREGGPYPDDYSLSAYG